MIPSATIPVRMPPAGEPIDILRVRLTRSERSAVVSELYTADTLLNAWAADVGQALAFSFEVTFADGCTFCGQYRQGKGRRSRPSLSRVVRRVFKSLRQSPPAWPEGIAFLKGPTAEFSRYAVGLN